MEIQSIKILNFRGIAEKEIRFKPGFNLIKGENGKGKTSILEAIAVGMGGFLAGIDGISTRHFSRQEIRRQYLLLGDGSYDEKMIMPTEVEMTALIDQELFTWKRCRSSVKSSRSSIQPRKICRKAELLSLSESAELPIISYQSAGRVWSQKGEKSDNIFRKNYTRAVGYTDALIDASNIKLLLNWCAKMEQISWQKEKKIAEYEAVKRAASRFMSIMNQDGEYELFYDKQTENLLFRKDSQVLPVDDLSAGYQSLIWMVFDIAYRMAVLNPDKKEHIAETSGVVLIDELDMHLHPKWQWNIVSALKNTFPNVQFIATTHAPILFVSAKDIWIVDIEQENVTYSYSHYGLDLNTAVKYYQDTAVIRPEVQKKADEFYQLLNLEEYKAAEKILIELEHDTAPSHPLLAQMRTSYELELMELED